MNPQGDCSWIIHQGLDVRLMNGTSRCEGRVEVYYANTWGTVCDDNWSIEGAHVVCRQLGCGPALSALPGTSFSPGSGSIILDDVNCTGMESSLAECPHSNWLTHNCGHQEDAGVICADSAATGHPVPGDVHAIEALGSQGDLHSGLNNGTSSLKSNTQRQQHISRTRQPVKANWVASDSNNKQLILSCKLYPIWGNQDPKNTAKKLRTNDIKRTREAASWKHKQSSIDRNTLNLKNRMWSYMFLCVYKSPTPAQPFIDRCLYPNNLQLVRLANGRSQCEGRVEVYFNGTWGSVCDDLWGIQAAQVVCQQLGCGVALAAPRSSLFGDGTGPIFLDDVRCLGTEVNLGHCHHLGLSVHNCDHHEDAGAICSEVLGPGRVSVSGASALADMAPTPGQLMIRLVNGKNRCEGRVEVHHNGTWGTVCDDLWGIEDAHVVCRQLDCGEGVSALGSSYFGEGVGSIFLDDVQCQGSESLLGQCQHQGLSIHNCGHHEDASVICSAFILFPLKIIITAHSLISNRNDNLTFTRACVRSKNFPTSSPGEASVLVTDIAPALVEVTPPPDEGLCPPHCTGPLATTPFITAPIATSSSSTESSPLADASSVSAEEETSSDASSDSEGVETSSDVFVCSLGVTSYDVSSASGETSSSNGKDPCGVT
ncbi:deleted in malignant brain tumors 1 protein [Sigmodon hispidus]